jgi:electron transport complex protein RnfG
MAISSVLPKFNGNLKQISIMPESGKDSVIVYLAYEGDQLFGGAVETYTDKAFSGTFSLMIGFDSAGNILGTEVLKWLKLRVWEIKSTRVNPPLPLNL